MSKLTQITAEKLRSGNYILVLKTNLSPYNVSVIDETLYKVNHIDSDLYIEMNIDNIKKDFFIYQKSFFRINKK